MLQNATEENTCPTCSFNEYELAFTYSPSLDYYYYFTRTKNETFYFLFFSIERMFISIIMRNMNAIILCCKWRSNNNDYNWLLLLLFCFHSNTILINSFTLMLILVFTFRQCIVLFAMAFYTVVVYYCSLFIAYGIEMNFNAK